jgi:hypothetical protein
MGDPNVTPAGPRWWVNVGVWFDAASPAESTDFYIVNFRRLHRVANVTIGATPG